MLGRLAFGRRAQPRRCAALSACASASTLEPRHPSRSRDVSTTSVRMWLVGLTWVFNRGALKGRSVLRMREDLWMSRDQLITHFGKARVDRENRPISTGCPGRRPGRDLSLENDRDQERRDGVMNSALADCSRSSSIPQLSEPPCRMARIKAMTTGLILAIEDVQGYGLLARPTGRSPRVRTYIATQAPPRSGSCRQDERLAQPLFATQAPQKPPTHVRDEDAHRHGSRADRAGILALSLAVSAVMLGAWFAAGYGLTRAYGALFGEHAPSVLVSAALLVLAGPVPFRASWPQRLA